ncbi:MAG: hypothetical protein JXQ99_24105 [Hyphomicrobiaceae bacterium]
MPEGHTIHRAARDLGRVLVGSTIDVTSPQGRFAGGAAVLDGRECLLVEAYGKHLLAEFSDNAFLHVHLGLFGRIRKHKIPAKEPKGAVRVRMVSATHVVDINGPTICEVLDSGGVADLTNRIGPDLIRADADPEQAFQQISKSRAPIGKLLMDQSVVAGIGNIYRTEILWRQSIHPDTTGRAITRTQFDDLWQDARALLAIGVKKNAIITVDQPSKSAAKARPPKRERLNIFNKTTCPRCTNDIDALSISGRRAFVCTSCQPIVEADP